MNEGTPKENPPTFVPPVSSFTGPVGELIAQRMLSPPPRPGLLAVVDHFEILRVLGGGGMGIVLLARDSDTGREVAIKLVKSDLVTNQHVVHRFLKEVGHLKRLQHTNIMPVQEISDRMDAPYFVMPYYEKGNLANRIKPGQSLDTESILDIAIQVAEGLSFAHRSGIIHRDLKPANILMGANGQVCLADFGLARTMFNDTIVDVEGRQLEGTAPYMSPAVAAGDAEDTRCDIYSFGALLYEMLTGQPPYKGRGTKEILDQILVGPPKSISSLNPAADRNLVAVAEGCMARELRDRYADMRDVLKDLQRIRENKRPTGQRGFKGQAGVKLSQIRRMLKFIWVPVCLALITVLLWRVWSPAQSATTLFLFPPFINKSTGEVTVNGADSRPSTPFTWNWGDGHVETGPFPMAHTYSDRTRNYEVTVTSQYRDGSTATAKVLVSFVTLSVFPPVVNTSSGKVTVNGVDIRGAVGPFTWNWDDGQVETGWFPMTHIYSDRTRNYEVTVTSHYGDGSTATAKVLVSFATLNRSAVYITTLAGQVRVGGYADGRGTQAQFRLPNSVAVDSAGNVYVADTANNVIRKIAPNGVVSTLAGLAGSHGSNDGPGSNARFWAPFGIAVDDSGNVYVADTANNAIREITPNGMVRTLAGFAGHPGSKDGIGAEARFRNPWSVAVDSMGNVFVADMSNDTIRKVTPAGMVTTLAGQVEMTGNVDGFGDGARFNDPFAVAVDKTGNVYVSDSANNAIRKITPGGAVVTLAGLPGYAGNADGNGNDARFWNPQGLAVDSAGNIYVADTGNNLIRKITPTGVVTTLPKSAGADNNTDKAGGSIQFSSPGGVALDNEGNIYVADSANHCIRKIVLSKQVNP